MSSYYSVKKDLLQCQKRPTTVSKETYYTAVEDELRALFDSVKVLEDALV
jgi:hypothetical protein